jgi:hypothetical protein
MFGNQLSRLHEVSHLAQQGESYDDLAIKIKDMLRDPIKKNNIPHLKNLALRHKGRLCIAVDCLMYFSSHNGQPKLQDEITICY